MNYRIINTATKPATVVSPRMDLREATNVARTMNQRDIRKTRCIVVPSERCADYLVDVAASEQTLVCADELQDTDRANLESLQASINKHC